MLGDLGKAKEFLDALFKSHVDNHRAPDQDDIIRMGVASAAHFIITVGKAAAELNGCNIPVNKYAYREIFPDDAGLDALLDDFSSLIDDPENDTRILTGRSRTGLGCNRCFRRGSGTV